MSDLTERETYERNQDQWLASFAVHEAQSGGRKFPEPEHAYRTCFQRDRDRVVHCAAFRRLDFKTQVFVPHQHDHFRTRMTHTLEVAQIGRTISRALRLNEDLVETVALAHDLGHPPFGHGGEAVLDELMAASGGFEHNRQSLRVVDYLEHPYPQFRGLNLSQVVRECLAKHQTRYDRPTCPEFDLTLQAPLEGQLVDLADEIAYTSADLEDALGAGWLTIDRLVGLSLWQRAWQVAEAEYPQAREIHKQIRAGKAILAAMTDDVIRQTRQNLAQLAPASLDDVRRAPRRLVGFTETIGQEVRQMQDFLLREVYLDPKADEKERQTRQILRDLFETYAKEPALLPVRYQQRIDAEGLPRVICDYIAGMTDRYCRVEHEKLRGLQK